MLLILSLLLLLLEVIFTRKMRSVTGTRPPFPFLASIAALPSSDSWQTASTSSFSPTFGGPAGNSLFGLEASVSVLANGSAGFEPPAPPTAETGDDYSPHHADCDVGTRRQMNGDENRPAHQRHGSGQTISDVDSRRDEGVEDSKTGGRGNGEHRLGRGERQGRAERGDIGRAGGRDHNDSELRGNAFQRRTDTGSIHSGDSHRLRIEHAVAATAVDTGHGRDSNAAPMVPTSGNDGRREMGVLHGISAAMASGALPAAARPKPNDTATPNQDRQSLGGDQTELPHHGDENAPHHLPRVVGSEYGDDGGRRLDSEELYMPRPFGGGDDAGGGAERGGFPSSEGGMSGDGGHDRELMGNWRKDAMGEQARRQIDEALRERALRRRKRFVVLLGP